MGGNNDGRSEVRELLPRQKQVGITAVALLALLIGVYAKASYAAYTFQEPVLNAGSDAFGFPETGPMRLRYSPSTGTNTAISFSDQIAIGTNDRLYGASPNVAAGKLPFWTLSAGANDADSCSDKDGSFQCLNRRLGLSGGMYVAVRTANTSGISDLPGYKVVVAENLSAGPHESTSRVRNRDTPGHKVSDLMPGNNALTSTVSEPRIYAMILAGLGLMGFVVSRRQT